MTAEQQLDIINHLTAQIRANQIALIRLGVHPPDATTREGQLLSELSEAGLREQSLARMLRHDGPMRTLPATARALIEQIDGKQDKPK